MLRKAWCKVCVKKKRKGYALKRNPLGMFFVCSTIDDNAIR